MAQNKAAMASMRRAELAVAAGADPYVATGLTFTTSKCFRDAYNACVAECPNVLTALIHSHSVQLSRPQLSPAGRLECMSKSNTPYNSRHRIADPRHSLLDAHSCHSHCPNLAHIIHMRATTWAPRRALHHHHPRRASLRDVSRQTSPA